MTRDNSIPEEMLSMMRFLGFKFNQTIKDSSSDAEDLYHDLIVLYLENRDKKVDYSINKWFIFFKSRLIDKYRRSGCYKQILENIKLERD